MLKPGMIIGDRYEIIDHIGAGGMSDVYKAKCHKLNRYVAIKVLKTEFSQDKNFLVKFQIEAQSAAGLSHPNIVNVYDVGEDEGIYYIVMELVEGITLKDYIHKFGRLPANQVVEFAVQIASGIETAHHNHTIHRDIKPQNIIVSNTGALKVTDFGIAKAATNQTVASSGAVGSVHYTSPEQARGGYCDEKSDIYSLGVTMYEMATGRVPFDGENNVAVALMHIQQDMIPPREYYPDIPRSLEKIIQKCTQKKSERRYLTANALIADLNRAMTEPDGNYIRLMPTMDGATTVMMSSDEMTKIKENTGRMSMPPEEIDYGSRYASGQSTDHRKPPVDEDVTGDEEVEDKPEDTEENGNGMDPKLEKLIYVIGGVAAVLVAMFLIFIIGKSLNLFQFGKGKDKVTTEITTELTTTSELTTESTQEVSVPTFIGHTLEDAQKMAEQADLKLEVEEVDNSSFEAGMVMEQDIDADEMVAPQSVIKLIVSKGAKKVSVPSVSNMTETEAVNTLSNEGLKLAKATANSDTVEKGRAMQQSPTANTDVPEGSTVTVTFSLGPEVKQVQVDSYVDMTKDDAIEYAKGQGLNVKAVGAYSDTAASGTVFQQSIEAGKTVDHGTTITLTYSLGKKEEDVKYQAVLSLSSNDCPFAEDESGRIKFTYNQNGKTVVVYDQKCTYDTFPSSVKFEVPYGGDITVNMYLDDEPAGSFSAVATVI